jgi:hypothetical protein
MKILFYLIAALLISKMTVSQTFYAEHQRDYTTEENILNSKYTNDSTYFWLGNTFGQSWFNNKIYRVEDFNNQGNVLTANDYEYDTIGMYWYKQRTYESQYFQTGFRKLWVSKIFDQSQNIWLIADSLYFNQDGNPQITWYKQWEPSEFRFTGGQRSTYIYDENGRLHVQFNQLWDTLAQSWLKAYYEQHYYYQNNLDSVKLTKIWDNSAGQYINSLLIHYLYNGQQALTEELVQSFSGGNWINYQRTEVSYTDFGKEDEIVEYVWLESVNQWFEHKKTVFLYNGQQLLTTKTDYQWDGAEWFNTRLVSYDYNQEGLIEERLDQYWSFAFDEWANASRTIYTYDENQNRKVYSYFTWITFSNEWRNEYREEKFWSFFESSNVFRPDVPQLNIYPNPATDAIAYVFSGRSDIYGKAEIFVYDQSGKFVKKIENEGHSGMLSIAGFKPGNYLIVYNLAGHTGSTILIKK